MAEGADVTVRYAFLPTKDSIKKSVSDITNQINRMAGQPISKSTAKKLNTQSNKTVEQVINVLRATQIKTSLQTKIMSGLNLIGDSFSKAVENFNSVLMDVTKWTPAISPTGIGKGQGGEVVEQGGPLALGAGGGVMGTLGLILGVLIVVSAAMMLIGAFFDAVGPIIKVVMKMISAMILILLMPFLKRGLPVLFGILKWMISAAKGISSLVEGIMSYFEKLVGRAMGGDVGAILELIVSWIFGPIGMLIMYLGPKIIEFLAGIDWKGLVTTKVLPILEGAFNIIKSAVDGIGNTIFGEETWAKIRGAVVFIANLFNENGIWQAIQAGIDYIGESIFGKGIWEEMKKAVDEIGLFLDNGFVKIMAALTDTGNAIEVIATHFRNMAAWYGGSGPSLVEQLFAGKGGSAYGEAPGMAWVGGTIGVSGGEGGNIMTPPTAAEWDEQFAKDHPDWEVNTGVSDFISRPGGEITPFSPNDTIIGVKDTGKLGGANITNNLYVSAGVDKKEFKKLLTDFSRQQGRELRNRTSYYGG